MVNSYEKPADCTTVSMNGAYVPYIPVAFVFLVSAGRNWQDRSEGSLTQPVEAAKQRILCLLAFGSLFPPTTWRAVFIKSHAESSLGESVISWITKTNTANDGESLYDMPIGEKQNARECKKSVNCE
jgi:hypothetical protein